MIAASAEYAEAAFIMLKIREIKQQAANAKVLRIVTPQLMWL